MSSVGPTVSTADGRPIYKRTKAVAIPAGQAGAVGHVEHGSAHGIAFARQPRRFAFKPRGVDVGQRDPRSRLGHDLGIGKANARGRAGDQRGPSSNGKLIERFHR